MVAIRSRRSSAKGQGHSGVSLINILIIHMVIIGSLVLIVPTQRAFEPEIVSNERGNVANDNERVAPRATARSTAGNKRVIRHLQYLLDVILHLDEDGLAHITRSTYASTGLEK